MKPWVAVAILALALGLLFLIMKPRRPNRHRYWLGPGGTRRMYGEGFYGGVSFNGAFSEGETDYVADAIQNRKDQQAYKTMS